MRALDRQTSRRSVLIGGAAAGLAWLGRPLLKPLRGRAQAASITAVPVDRVPDDPNDPVWLRAPETLVSLEPQNIVVPRVREAGAKRIDVRVLYDPDRISFLLDWRDAHRDVDLGTVLQYRDAVAIQFPEDPTEPTSHMMGTQGRAVVIYHWKSDWQFGRLYDVDEAYPNMYADWYQHSGVAAGEMAEATDYLTKGRKEYLTAAAAGNPLADPLAQEKIGPVQKMRAEGFGSLESHGVQDARGVGAWQDGGWRIAITIPRRQDSFTFGEGSMVPVAFAVWDGSRDERNGQKALALWRDMRLASAVETAVSGAGPREGQEGGVGALWPVLGGSLGGAAAIVAGLIALRMRRAKSEERSTSDCRR